MKRFLPFFAALTFLVSALTGCGGSAPASSQESSSAAASSAISQPEEDRGPNLSLVPENAVFVDGSDPLTGGSVDRDDESRPIAIMLQNDKRGYPQWGIGAAEVVVEAITEGTQTSMMAMYSGHEGLPAKVGAVGPGRDLFWQMAMPTDSVLMQIGSNIYADNLLNYYGYQNLDGHYVGVAAYDLDYEKSKTANNEYCWYTNQELMRDGLEHYGLSEDGDRQSLFNFAPEDDESEFGGEEADQIEITFAEENTVPLTYNEDEGGWDKYDLDWEPQVDGGYSEEIGVEDKMLRFDNVLVLYCSAGIKDDGYTRDYDLTGGTGLYLYGPACQKIRWEKPAEDRGFTIYDESGENELPVRVGKTYIAVYGGFDGQDVSVQANGEALELWDDPEPMPTPDDEE